MLVNKIQYQYSTANGNVNIPHGDKYFQRNSN